MASITLTTSASIPTASQQIDVTVFEDSTGDGNANASATQTIDNGSNSYTLAGFDAAGGNDYWFSADFETSDETVTASLGKVTIDRA